MKNNHFQITCCAQAPSLSAEQVQDKIPEGEADWDEEPLAIHDRPKRTQRPRSPTRPLMQQNIFDQKAKASYQMTNQSSSSMNTIAFSQLNSSRWEDSDGNADVKVTVAYNEAANSSLPSEYNEPEMNLIQAHGCIDDDGNLLKPKANQTRRRNMFSQAQ